MTDTATISTIPASAGEDRGQAPVGIPVESAIAGLLSRLTPGTVGVLGPVDVPGFKPRHLRIYLPRAHDASTTHRALWMFDGQNVFDDAPSYVGGWHLHHAVEGQARAGRPAPVVIGIDHGGSERIHELSPFPVHGEAPRIDPFLDWVTGVLLPLLSAELRLGGGPAGTIVGGSSMGGLAAFYAHFRHPRVFGGALAMSPSFWVGSGGRLRKWVANRPLPAISRIYLDYGEGEGRGMLRSEVEAMASFLRAQGYGRDRLLAHRDPQGHHDEASWRRRLPRALRFLFR